MLRSIVIRVRRAVANRPPTAEQSEQAAAAVRQDRAAVVQALWSDVRRVQRDIKDVSDARARDVPEGERAILDGRLAALEAELERTQGELAKLQGRV